jgi:hypothetical protein
MNTPSTAEQAGHTAYSLLPQVVGCNRTSAALFRVIPACGEAGVCFVVDTVSCAPTGNRPPPVPRSLTSESGCLALRSTQRTTSWTVGPFGRQEDNGRQTDGTTTSPAQIEPKPDNPSISIKCF